MTILLDFDSLIYTSVYKIVSISDMRDALEKYGKENARQWMKETVLNESVNRCENEILKICNFVDSLVIDDITGCELFITTCKKPFRKELTSVYKSSRKRNNWVWMIRDYYQLNGASYDDVYEADDLIYDRAKELGKDNCIVVSIDKDLKQISGYYWSYYKTAQKNMDGTFILDDYGNKVKDYKQQEMMYITDHEANLFLWQQMLIGDSGDDVQGIKVIGKVRAEKLLKDVKNPFITVAREYIKREQKEQFKINYQLLKLGKR